MAVSDFWLPFAVRSSGRKVTDLVIFFPVLSRPQLTVISYALSFFFRMYAMRKPPLLQAEQIGVRAGADKIQFVFVYLVYKQPVGEYMAFPTACISTT